MTRFERIYETYFNDVFHYIRRLSKNESIAEEITSETFFKAMKSLDSFRGDCDIFVWLCQIAKNTYYSYLKKNRNLVELEALETAELADGAEAIEDTLSRKSDAREIYTLLHELPEPYKEVFMLRVMGELSFREIGAVFGKTDNWACVTYHRAKRKITQRLEGEKDE